MYSIIHKGHNESKTRRISKRLCIRVYNESLEDLILAHAVLCFTHSSNLTLSVFSKKKKKVRHTKYEDYSESKGTFKKAHLL